MPQRQWPLEVELRGVEPEVRRTNPVGLVDNQLPAGDGNTAAEHRHPDRIEVEPCLAARGVDRVANTILVKRRHEALSIAV